MCEGKIWIEIMLEKDCITVLYLPQILEDIGRDVDGDGQFTECIMLPEVSLEQHLVVKLLILNQKNVGSISSLN